LIGHINLGMKQTGKRSAGKPHAAFDEAGTGNGFTVWLVRHSQRKRGATDRPDLRDTAPVLDPTCEGLGVKFPGATRPETSGHDITLQLSSECLQRFRVSLSLFQVRIAVRVFPFRVAAIFAVTSYALFTVALAALVFPQEPLQFGVDTAQMCQRVRFTSAVLTERSTFSIWPRLFTAVT
jgi:hypothetical protein